MSTEAKMALAAQLHAMAETTPADVMARADPGQEGQARAEMLGMMLAGTMHALAGRLEAGCTPAELAVEYVIVIGKLNNMLLRLISLGTDIEHPSILEGMEAIITDIGTATRDVYSNALKDIARK
jgi:hypothetical protein